MKPVMKNDSAVSEIIGAILLFAIASVLLTSFILWYVPSTGTNNDITYQSQTQQSFSSLDSKILSPTLVPGSSVSQSVPLGISGVPPFSPSQSTNLYYNHNFNASMSYKANVTYENAIPIKNVTTAAFANASGSNIQNNVYASSQFTYSVIFAENGLPQGYYWSVSLGGQVKSAGSTSTGVSSYITYSLPRGTYSYAISSNIKGSYSPNPSSGTVKVNTSGESIGITFSNGQINGVVAEAQGPNSQINDVNQSNFVGLVTQSNVENIQYLNYWLYDNNTSGVYNLSSQEFFVYNSNTPVDYYHYLIEPNIVYSEQRSQGNAIIYSSIGNSTWGGTWNGTQGVATFSQSQINSQCSQTVNISFPTVTLQPGTYFLNIWEQVKENKTNNNNKNYNLEFATSLNPIQEAPNGYGYGPNEFIGTITNPSLNVAVGYAYYYKATTAAICNGGNVIFSGPTYFEVQKENLVASSTPYYFLIGYTPTASGTTCPLTINENNLPAGLTWNLTLNNKVYPFTTTSSGKNTFSIPNLPLGIYPYQISRVGKYLSNPSDGFINIVTNPSKDQLNVSFFEPVGSLPNSWDITDYASQQIQITKEQKINYLSLYFFNYTIGPASFTGNCLNDTVDIQILNANNSQPVSPGATVNNFKVYETGWTQVFFNNSKGFIINPGKYLIHISDVGGNANTIGLGFTTTGGYSNYYQRVSTNYLNGNLNIQKNITLTPYYGGSPIKITNTSLLFQIGFFNVTTSFVINNISLVNTFNIAGSIQATGNTQFAIQETYALQDGIIITAGKGVTYVTVNPLPIAISNTSGSLSLSSIAYNFAMAKSVATSISGYGSTIVSATLENQSLANYTVGNNYLIGTVFAKVLNITLYRYNYTINSQFSKYWANTFFVELVGGSQTQNYTDFNAFNLFNFLLNGDKETVSISHPVTLSTISLKNVGMDINSM